MHNDHRSGVSHAWPTTGWLGVALVVVFWALNWGLDGLRTHWGFLPLWLGYCLVVDAWCVRRKGDSLLRRDPKAWAVLFGISVPAWWLFELLNRRTQNWSYIGREHFSDLEYAVLASLSFSTVMPAVFGTAELIGSMRWLQRRKRGPSLRPTAATRTALFASGWVLLAAVLVWPEVCFPLVWGAVFLILDPLNFHFGNGSILAFLARGDWRPVWALALGGLVCGFFWELWNTGSYPKWEYRIPHVDFLRLFGMPILGYGGYLPFALELFALYHLALGVLGRRHRDRLELVAGTEA